MFPIQRIDHRDSELYFCIFSPDGNLLATGGKEANIDIWIVDKESHTVTLSRTLFTTESMINHMCWSPDSIKYVLSSAFRLGQTEVAFHTLNISRVVNSFWAHSQRHHCPLLVEPLASNLTTLGGGPLTSDHLTSEPRQPIQLTASNRLVRTYPFSFCLLLDCRFAVAVDQAPF